MLEKLKLSSNDEILDSSAGTGILAGSILKKHTSFKKIVLNDPSAKMLEIAKYRLRNFKNIEFSAEFCEDLTFPDHAFSQIICQNAFHYYTNQDDVIGQFRRLLEPGGNLWILDWNRTGFFKIVNKFIDWFTPEVINSRTLSEMKSLLQDNAFEIVEEETWRYRWWNFFFVRCARR